MDIQFPSSLQDRGDKPSASSTARYANCPGSFQIESLIPEPPSSEVAALGNDVHLALSGGKVELTEEGHSLVAMCLSRYESLANEIIGDASPTTLVEQRLWWNDEWSGQADRIDLWGNNALVVDYKTGRGDVDPANHNLQLRALAVLVAKKFPEVSKIYVAIIAPMSIGTTVSCYEGDGLTQSREEILEIMEKISLPGAPRIPSGSACKYCKAKAVCPEVREEALTIRDQVVVPTLSNDQVADLLGRADYIEDFITALRAEAKARLKNGQHVPGYKLSPGRTTRAIGDASAAFQIVADIMSSEDFVGACKVSVPSLEKAYAKATGLKGKGAKDAFELALSSVIETKVGDQILTKEAA